MASHAAVVVASIVVLAHIYYTSIDDSLYFTQMILVMEYSPQDQQ